MAGRMDCDARHNGKKVRRGGSESVSLSLSQQTASGAPAFRGRERPPHMLDAVAAAFEVFAANLAAAAGVFVAAFLLSGFGDYGRNWEVVALFVHGDES